MCVNEAADLYQLLRSRQVPILFQFQVFISSLDMPIEGTRRLYRVNDMVLSEKTNFTACQCNTSLYYSVFYYPHPENKDIQKRFSRIFGHQQHSCFGKFGEHDKIRNSLSISLRNNIFNYRKNCMVGIDLIHSYIALCY